MMTPQEVSEHAFSKSAFGGYNMTMVDEFLDELTDDYTALYKENAALKAKMKVLVDKVEEYRATEDAMRRALLAAQTMASNLVSEAEEKKETLLADAEMEARAKLGALHDELVAEQKRLNLIKAQTREYADKARAICQLQLRALEELNQPPQENDTGQSVSMRSGDGVMISSTRANPTFFCTLSTLARMVSPTAVLGTKKTISPALPTPSPSVVSEVIFSSMIWFF